MWTMLEQRLMARLRTDASIRARVRKLEADVAEGRVAPALAAEQLALLLT
jgi:LAO/AO transport system kinase